jgi:hypothetical protein
MQIKRFTIKLILFIAFFIATYCAMLFAMSYLKVGGNKFVYRAVQGLVWKGGDSFERFRQFNEKNNYDILIFGSSRANRGINPGRFEKAGYSAYNLGTDDQTPINSDVLIRNFVKKGKCNLVIFDVYDKVACQRPLESNSDLIQNLNKDAVAFNMTVAAEDLRAVNQLGVRMALKSQPPQYSTEGKLYQGFRSVEEPFHYLADWHYYQTNSKQLIAFERTLQYLKSIDVPFLIVCQPLPLMPLNHMQFVNDIKGVLKKYNTPLYDFTNYRKLVNPGGFSDMSHLNKIGADRYSDFLLDSLVKNTINNNNLFLSDN